MKQETALQYVNHFMTVLQRYRSVVLENLLQEDRRGLGLTDEQLSSACPWIFGERCPLPMLEKILDRGTLAPPDFYNLMFLLDRFMPEVKAAGEISYQVQFPDPDTEWLHGWEEPDGGEKK